MSAVAHPSALAGTRDGGVAARRAVLRRAGSVLLGLALVGVRLAATAAGWFVAVASRPSSPGG